jgi:gamma-glutamylcyclotransferase (GGCT)/AIG2-like uncharacterized protein YtfP
MIIKRKFGEFLQQALRNSALTPDNIKLQSLNKHNVFTYGTLMTGMPRNHLMTKVGRGVKIGNAVTMLDKFIMYRKREPSSIRYPVAFYEQGPEQAYYSARLRGEIWQVDSEFIQYLDEIEANLIAYKRLRLVVEALPPLTGTFVCWTYLGLFPYWEKTIDNFGLIDCMEHKTLHINGKTLPIKNYFYDNYEHTVKDIHF